MAYTKVTTRTKRGDVVCEYHSAKYGAPGQKRQKKKKATPEQIEARLKEAKFEPKEKFERGFVRHYIDNVMQADKGCDFPYL